MADSSFSVSSIQTESSEYTQPPPEIESTLARLSAYRNVRGVMILSRSTGDTDVTGGIIQHTGSIFEGEKGRTYARVVEGLVKSVSSAVTEVDEGVCSGPFLPSLMLLITPTL